MPTNVVKTEKDEELWRKAEAYCRDQGLSPSENEDRFYKCVNGTYQRMTEGQGGADQQATPAQALRRWLTNYDA